ncbi:hypothetical protein ACFQU7_37860 [Pseudoroseomonas wenyumeiae]
MAPEQAGGIWVDPSALHLNGGAAWAGRHALLQLVAHLWTQGLEPLPGALAGVSARRVALPTYPFERQRFWVEAAPQPVAVAEPPAVAAPTSASAPDARSIRLVLQQIVGHALHLPPEQVSPDRDFIEMGADSWCWWNPCRRSSAGWACACPCATCSRPPPPCPAWRGPWPRGWRRLQFRRRHHHPL